MFILLPNIISSQKLCLKPSVNRHTHIPKKLKTPPPPPPMQLQIHTDAFLSTVIGVAGAAAAAPSLLLALPPDPTPPGDVDRELTEREDESAMGLTMGKSFPTLTHLHSAIRSFIATSTKFLSGTMLFVNESHGSIE